MFEPSPQIACTLLTDGGRGSVLFSCRAVSGDAFSIAAHCQGLCLLICPFPNMNSFLPIRLLITEVKYAHFVRTFLNRKSERRTSSSSLICYLEPCIASHFRAFPSRLSSLCPCVFLTNWDHVLHRVCILLSHAISLNVIS